MSNSFPSMISNEPPPLEQSDDDEDEDSEGFRDFASGLKLDVDPSPMSTPRKDGSGSLPVHNGSITPELGRDSKDSSTNPSPFKTPLKETAKPPEENIIAASAFTGFTSGGGSIMKTSYIGTLESEFESTTDDAPEVKSDTDSIPEPSVPKAEQVTNGSPLASEVADEDSIGDNLDDFKDFQSVESPPVLCEPPKTDHVTLESSDEVVGLSACTEEEEEVSQDLRTDSPASCAQENTEVTPPVMETVSPEDATPEEISHDSPSKGQEQPLEGSSDCSPEAETVKATDQELEKTDTDETSPQIPSELTNPEPIYEVTPESVSKGEEGFGADSPSFEDDDDDFEDFQVSVPVHASPISTQKPEEQVPQSVDAATEDNDDDGFSNFQANFSTVEPVATEPSPSNADGFSDDGDDFDDFQAFQTTQSAATIVSSSDENVNTGPSTAASAGIFSSQRSALLQDKFDVLVKNLFALNTNVDEPENSAVFKPIDKKLKEESSEDVWTRVEDFEGSQGLVFKWLNSEAHQRLLDSLKIDTSTVLYSGKWGAVQVPRFAASLVDTPLQPQNIPTSAGTGTVPDNVRRTSSGGTAQDESKVAHPDDAGVMVNGKTPTVNGRILSREAEQIISQLPDLSFMRAKNLVFPNSSASHVVSSDV